MAKANGAAPAIGGDWNPQALRSKASLFLLHKQPCMVMSLS